LSDLGQSVKRTGCCHHCTNPTLCSFIGTRYIPRHSPMLQPYGYPCRGRTNTNRTKNYCKNNFRGQDNRHRHHNSPTPTKRKPHRCCVARCKKIGECVTLCTTKLQSGVILVDFDDTFFTVIPMAGGAKASP
jgi:hypothetical protein